VGVSAAAAAAQRSDEAGHPSPHGLSSDTTDRMCDVEGSFVECDGTATSVNE